MDKHLGLTIEQLEERVEFTVAAAEFQTLEDVSAAGATEPIKCGISIKF
jgi:hypothetical protein